MGSVAVVIADALFRASAISVLVDSLLSLAVYDSSGSAVVQHASSLVLLSIYLFRRLTNKPAQIGTNESPTCCGIIRNKTKGRGVLA